MASQPTTSPTTACDSQLSLGVVTCSHNPATPELCQCKRCWNKRRRTQEQAHKRTYALTHSNTYTHSQRYTTALETLDDSNKQILIERAYLERSRPEDRDGSEADYGRVPYWMRPLVTVCREERVAAGVKPKDYGRTWKAAFRAITGDTPKCAPGDRDAARLFLYRVRQALALGYEDYGCQWTPSDWRTLHRLERVWERRAQGKDPRYEVMGTAPGKAGQLERGRINTLDTLIRIGERA